MNVNAVVLTFNEEKNIRQCLETLQWCDDVIVIDSFSTDATVEIAKKAGARVFQRELDHDFASQRNFGLEKANSEWVLFVDADERVSPPLAEEIRCQIDLPAEASAQAGKAGFLVKRDDYFLGKRLRFGESASVRLVRLGKKSAGLWERPVHETWKLKGNVGNLKNHLEHYPHQSVLEFLRDIDRYTDIEANYRRSKGVFAPAVLAEAIFFPPLKFISNYLFRLGFLDGIPGLVMALGMSWHSFLVRAKLLTKK